MVYTMLMTSGKHLISYYTNSRIQYYIELGMSNYRISEEDYIELLLNRGFNSFILMSEKNDISSVIKIFKSAQEFFNRKNEKNTIKQTLINFEIYNILNIFCVNYEKNELISMLLCYDLIRD